MSSSQAINIFELLLFFLSFYFFLNMFKAIDYSKLFRKGKVREAQLTYIFTVLIFSYLFTRSIVRLMELTIGIL